MPLTKRLAREAMPATLQMVASIVRAASAMSPGAVRVGQKFVLSHGTIAHGAVGLGGLHVLRLVVEEERATESGS